MEVNEQERRSSDHLFERMCGYMNKKFAGMDTKADGISAKVDGVSASVTLLAARVDGNASDISNLQKQIDRIKSGLRERGPDILRLDNEIEKLKVVNKVWSDANADGRQPGADEKRYWLARRAVRVWPVEGLTIKDLWSATGRFFFDVLRVPEENLEESSVEAIRRVSPQNRTRRRRNDLHDEVVVHFKDFSTRDMIQSYAPNLSEHRGRGKAGMRLEVPCHLTGCFKCLERYGNIMKKQHPGLKWHINYDDVELSLMLSMKFPDGESWERVNLELGGQRVGSRDRPHCLRTP